MDLCILLQPVKVIPSFWLNQSFWYIISGLGEEYLLLMFHLSLDNKFRILGGFGV